MDNEQTACQLCPWSTIQEFSSFTSPRKKMSTTLLGHDRWWRLASRVEIHLYTGLLFTRVDEIKKRSTIAISFSQSKILLLAIFIMSLVTIWRGQWCFVFQLTVCGQKSRLSTLTKITAHIVKFVYAIFCAAYWPLYYLIVHVCIIC